MINYRGLDVCQAMFNERRGRRKKESFAPLFPIGQLRRANIHQSDASASLRRKREGKKPSKEKKISRCVRFLLWGLIRE